MKILLDHGTPAPLSAVLIGHSVTTSHQKGWSELDNGSLLAVAEAEFDVLITTDQNLQYQQNLTGRRLAILVLPTTSWPRLRQHAAQIIAAVEALKAGDLSEMKL